MDNLYSLCATWRVFVSVRDRPGAAKEKLPWLRPYLWAREFFGLAGVRHLVESSVHLVGMGMAMEMEMEVSVWGHCLIDDGTLLNKQAH